MSKKLTFFFVVLSMVISGRASIASQMLDPDEVSFTGVVKFEQRFTRIEPTQCSILPCQRSEPYWSLVIDTGMSRYLLNQRIEGLQAPQSFQLNGVTLRAGSRVRVWGEAIPEDPDFFILLSVRKVSLLKSMGWSCRSAENVSSVLLANVWYEITDDHDGSYKMRLQEVQGRAIYQIAFLNHALFTARSNELVFEGISSGAKIELDIENEPGKSIDFAGRLKITAAPQDRGLPREANIEMICNHTRFSDS